MSTQASSEGQASYSTSIAKQVNKKTSKEKSWFQFIDEKLNEWPLWNKIVGKHQMNPQQIQKSISKRDKGVKYIVVDDVPEISYYGRSSMKTYHYYNCKQDKLTYFFPMAHQRYWYIEVFQIPTKFARPIDTMDHFVKINKKFQQLSTPEVYVMPTQKAMPKIEKIKRKNSTA